MRYILMATLITLSFVAFAAEPRTVSVPPPSCFEETEDCFDAWYEYGDATGDYGPIDAAN